MMVALMCADNQSGILLVVRPGISRYQAVSGKIPYCCAELPNDCLFTDFFESGIGEQLP
jgi:hypothetical protein